MKPRSGKYEIKIKIDEICGYSSNIVGIVSQHSKNNIIIKHNGNNNRKTLKWHHLLYDYIGWSARGNKDNTYLPNGLCCGNNESSRTNNIFRRNSFMYKSNNENYQTRLPPIKTGDIMILTYDSNNGILSFTKENDNSKLNAQIYNLPKGNTFYWFVGHIRGKMSLSVL